MAYYFQEDETEQASLEFYTQGDYLLREKEK